MHIKLGIRGIFWGKRPRFRVRYNDIVQFENEISAATDEIEYIEFDINQYTELGSIAVEFFDKTVYDTVQNAEKTAIINDLLLDIASLEVDGESLNHLVYSKSEYRPIYPAGFGGDKIEVLTGVTTLGWNGVWNLTWKNHKQHTNVLSFKPSAIPESLTIKLGLMGRYWDRRPEYRIMFNETLIAQKQFSADSGDIEYIEFPIDYSTNIGAISVELLNKYSSDTIQNSDSGQIINDMTLEIGDLEIDNISINTLLHQTSKFYPHYPAGYEGEIELEINDCITLGRHGVWIFSWTNPFYIWLLENL